VLDDVGVDFVFLVFMSLFGFDVVKFDFSLV